MPTLTETGSASVPCTKPNWPVAASIFAATALASGSVATSQRDREAIAGDSADESAGAGRALNEATDALDDLVAGTQPERFVDRGNLVDVDVEQRGRGSVEGALGAALEDEAIRQTRQRVVLAAQDRHGLAADELEDADVARLEIGSVGRAKQGDQAEHAVTRVAQRTRKYLVGGGGAGSIDDHRAIVEPHPREQVLLGAVE